MEETTQQAIHLTGSYIRVVFEEENLSGCDLSQGEYVDVQFVKTDLTRAKLSGGQLYMNISFVGSTLKEANLEGVQFTGTLDLTRVDLSYANLRGLQLNGSLLSRTQLEAQAISLEGATLPDGSTHP